MLNLESLAIIAAVCALTVFACNQQLGTTSQQLGGEEPVDYCGSPPVHCLPITDPENFCSTACLNETAYCPDYPDYAYTYCKKHYDAPDKCKHGLPSYYIPCLAGRLAAPAE